MKIYACEMGEGAQDIVDIWGAYTDLKVLTIGYCDVPWPGERGVRMLMATFSVVSFVACGISIVNH